MKHHVAPCNQFHPVSLSWIYCKMDQDGLLVLTRVADIRCPQLLTAKRWLRQWEHTSSRKRTSDYLPFASCEWKQIAWICFILFGIFPKYRVLHNPVASNNSLQWRAILNFAVYPSSGQIHVAQTWRSVPKWWVGETNMFEGWPIINDHQVVICCDFFFCVFSSLGITTTDIGCLKMIPPNNGSNTGKWSADQPFLGPIDTKFLIQSLTWSSLQSETRNQMRSLRSEVWRKMPSVCRSSRRSTISLSRSGGCRHCDAMTSVPFGKLTIIYIYIFIYIIYEKSHVL